MGILWGYPQDFLCLTGPDPTGQSADFVGDPAGTRGLCPVVSGLISSHLLFFKSSCQTQLCTRSIHIHTPV